MGPYPPPHGGISVHVRNACALVRRHGATAKVLNVDPRAARSDAYMTVDGAADLAFGLWRHAWNGWKIHAQINGHTPKSWAIALAAGVAAQMGAGGLLTIHSGIAPQYLRDCSITQRACAQLACLQFERIVCVNDEIVSTVQGLGIPPHRTVVIPAFLPLTVPSLTMPADLESWLKEHERVLSTAMFFRPEYGFELLLEGLKRLVGRYPRLGCLVMGDSEGRMAAEMQINQAGLSGSVRLLGDIDHDLCLFLIARSGVFVRPTLRDGDSICVREAVSLGIPVVASDVGTRPAEALLFDAGNVDAMIAQIDLALAMERKQAAAGAGCDTVERLINVYASQL